MRKPARLLLLSYLAFVSLGLPDTIFGVAWPSLRRGFGLSQSAIGAILVSGVSGYFLSGLVAGSLMARVGVGRLLAASSALVALGLGCFSLAPSWSLFFPVAFLVGLGSGAIDAALNSHAARHFSVRHVNWLHACWGVGASIGPAIMTAAIARGTGYRLGYALIGGVLAAMALAFVATRRAWDESEPAPRPSASPLRSDARTTLQSGSVWLLMATFFFYTGFESSVGQWCFTLLTEARGLGVEAAGAWTSAYWASLTLGRLLLGWAVDRVGADRLLRAASVGAVSGAALFATIPGLPGRLGLVLLGASLAPMYPTLMARTPARVGANHANHAVGFLVSAATLGSASLPALVGLLVAGLGLGAIGSATLVMGLAFLALHETLLRVTRGASQELAQVGRG